MSLTDAALCSALGVSKEIKTRGRRHIALRLSGIFSKAARAEAKQRIENAPRKYDQVVQERLATLQESVKELGKLPMEFIEPLREIAAYKMAIMQIGCRFAQQNPGQELPQALRAISLSFSALFTEGAQTAMSFYKHQGVCAHRDACSHLIIETAIAFAKVADDATSLREGRFHGDMKYLYSR